MSFIGSYVWQLRQVWGSKTLLLPGVSTIVINQNNEVLLGLRTDMKNWCHFGGSGEPSEDVISTMKREVAEEIGVDPTEFKAFAFTSKADTNTNVYPNGDRINFWDLCFLVTGWQGEMRVADDEHSEIRFFALNALPSPLAKDTANVLRLLAEYQRTGEFQIR